MAFRVHKVQGQKEALKHDPQDRDREAPNGIPSQKLLDAIPQRGMHKAVMLSIGASNFEVVKM